MRKGILTILLISVPLICCAQRIVLGSCATKDGGLYKGEIVANKPHGKGVTTFKNGMVFILLLMVRSMTDSGFKINNMEKEPIIL